MIASLIRVLCEGSLQLPQFLIKGIILIVRPCIKIESKIFRYVIRNCKDTHTHCVLHVHMYIPSSVDEVTEWVWPVPLPGEEERAASSSSSSSSSSLPRSSRRRASSSTLLPRATEPMKLEVEVRGGEWAWPASGGCGLGTS